MALQLPFQPGDWVVLVLRDPRERVWGRLLGLEPAGVAIRGMDVKPWEEIIRLVSGGQGEQVAVGTHFYPLHRLESLYLDEPAMGIPSLQAEFASRTGLEPEALIGPPGRQAGVN